MEPARATWTQLQHATVADLEALYRAPNEVHVPNGSFAGRHLIWLDTRGANHPVLRPVEQLFFADLPWVIDFDRRRWFWFQRRFGVGRFSTSVGPSRWRDAETVRMLYDDPLLPGFVNLWLYDEVKPLDHDLCLGLGGFSARRGVGDQFFFALRRVG